MSKDLPIFINVSKNMSLINVYLFYLFKQYHPTLSVLRRVTNDLKIYLNLYNCFNLCDYLLTFKYIAVY